MCAIFSIFIWRNRLIGVVLVFVDITIVIVDIVVDPPEGSSGMEVYDIFSMIIWFYFFFEILLRIFAKGWVVILLFVFTSWSHYI